MAVAVPAPATGVGARTPRRVGRLIGFGVVAALLLGAAGVVGWAVRGGPGVSAGDAGARYEAMIGPVNERCTGSMAAPTADAVAKGPCGPALAMFAAAVRNGVWPTDAMDEANRLADAAESQVRWLSRIDAATSVEERQAVVAEILRQQPIPYVATSNAAHAFRDALGLVGGPNPLV